MPTVTAKDILEANIEDAVSNLTKLRSHGEALERAATLLADCLLGGNKLLVCGNGGSSADATHIVTEFVGRFVKERKGYPAIALGDSSGILTAVSNDYGFDHVFARQVQAYGQAGDVLLAISTSGNSANVVQAIQEASKLGLSTISLLGRDGGKAKGLSTVEMIVDHPSTARVQEAHQLLYHCLCQLLDDVLT